MTLPHLLVSGTGSETSTPTQRESIHPARRPLSLNQGDAHGEDVISSSNVEAEKATPHQQPFTVKHEKEERTSPSPGSPVETGKASGDEEAPESEAAHLERLGRERPTKFQSTWAEVAFCYSIIASQFMAASLSLSPARLAPNLTSKTGILRLRLQRPAADSNRQTRHPAGVRGLAGVSLHHRHRSFSAPVWPPG